MAEKDLVVKGKTPQNKIPHVLGVSILKGIDMALEKGVNGFDTTAELKNIKIKIRVDFDIDED